MKNMSIFIGAVLYPANGRWLDLPATDEEIEEAIAYAQTPDCEEVIISDSEGIECNEYSNIYEVNERAETIENLDKYDREIFEALINEADYSFENALEVIENGNYRIYPDCYSMTDVAYEVVAESDIFRGASEVMQRYFDFEAYGRDLDLEGEFYYTSIGYIEIY